MVTFVVGLGAVLLGSSLAGVLTVAVSDHLTQSRSNDKN
jgi:hypothetical protein